MGERVLVTGAGGFVGRHAARALVDLGWDVHATHVESSAPVDVSGVTWHRCDLFSTSGVRDRIEHVRPKRLLHLAWYAEHGRFWTSPENLRWIGSTLDLVRQFRENGGERIVVAGTCAEYAWGTSERLREDSPIAPSTLYGASKDVVRRMLSAYLAGTDVSWATGRLFFLYGPHEHPDRFVTHVATQLLRGQSARCTHGKQVRDFLHVADVGRALASLLVSSISGPVNIASGEPVTLASVAETLHRIVGRGSLELGAIPARADDPTHIVADATRLHDEVKFRPTFDLEGGLRDLVEWLRVNVNEGARDPAPRTP